MESKKRTGNQNINENQRQQKALKSQNANQTLVGNSMRFRPVTPNRPIRNQYMINNTGIPTMAHIVEQHTENNIRNAKMNNLAIYKHPKRNTFIVSEPSVSGKAIITTKPNISVTKNKINPGSSNSSLKKFTVKISNGTTNSKALKENGKDSSNSSLKEFTVKISKGTTNSKVTQETGKVSRGNAGGRATYRANKGNSENARSITPRNATQQFRSYLSMLGNRNTQNILRRSLITALNMSLSRTHSFDINVAYRNSGFYIDLLENGVLIGYLSIHSEKRNTRGKIISNGLHYTNTITGAQYKINTTSNTPLLVGANATTSSTANIILNILHNLLRNTANQKGGFIKSNVSESLINNKILRNSIKSYNQTISLNSANSLYNNKDYPKIFYTDFIYFNENNNKEINILEILRNNKINSNMLNLLKNIYLDIEIILTISEVFLKNQYYAEN